ncbi:MAG: hypothetical protein R3C15_19030 [Thermoleophilia bacterium]
MALAAVAHRTELLPSVGARLTPERALAARVLLGTTARPLPVAPLASRAALDAYAAAGRLAPRPLVDLRA